MENPINPIEIEEALHCVGRGLVEFFLRLSEPDVEYMTPKRAMDIFREIAQDQDRPTDQVVLLHLAAVSENILLTLLDAPQGSSVH